MGDIMKQIVLLFGGTSNEHEVSIMSAKEISAAIDKNLFNVSICYISKDNKWYKFDGDFDKISDSNWLANNDDNEIFNIVRYLQYFDVVFPIMHGKNGEDGRLQGMLELFNIPFVGSNMTSSSLGMDKELSKIIFGSANIPQLPFVTIYTSDYVLEDIYTKFDFPIIIKPANGGSSIGIHATHNIKELQEAIIDASKYDTKLIAEPFIKAQELECAVLENNGIITSRIGEILSANEFYDFNAKYENEKSKTVIPASIEENIVARIQKYAKTAFKVIGARGLARIDFFYDKNKNQIYLNEINTIPGFTRISMYPKLIEDIGISYTDLITTLIENALK